MVSQQVGDTFRKEAASPPRRPFWSRMSVGQIVMLIAGLAAFVLNVNVIRAQEAITMVAVATEDLEPGVPFKASMVEFVPIDAENPVIDRLIPEDVVASREGMILTSRVLEGEFLAAADLAEEAADANLRAFTIRVPASHAGGGGLIDRGDLVDIIAVEAGVARYVVTGAEVLHVPAEDASGGIVAVADYHLVVAVDADTALALSEALQTDSVEVVLATGAPEPDRLTLATGTEEAAEPDGDATSGEGEGGG